MGKIKILQVNVDDKNNGGVFSLMKNVYYHMPKDIIFDFWTVEPIQNISFRKYIYKRGGKIFCLNKKNKYTRIISNYFQLKYYLKNSNYDAIHIHSDKAALLFIYSLAARRVKSNTIIHSHATGVDMQKNRKIFEIIQNIFKKLISYSNVKYYLACSEDAAKWMYSDEALKKTIIINNGIDVGKFKYDDAFRKEIRIKHGFQDYFVLGHVGRFTYVKNHEFIIKLFYEIKKKHEKIKLILIGEGIPELRDRIIEQTKKLGIYSDILFIRETNEIHKYMSAMDLFILPSVIEGFPIVNVEAQATGLPCIVSSCVPKEAKINENFSRLSILQLDDWIVMIERYIESNKYIDRENAWKKIIDSNYDIGTTVNQLLSVYKNN